MNIDSTRSDRCLARLIDPFVKHVTKCHKRRPKPLRIEFVARRQPDPAFPHPLRAGEGSVRTPLCSTTDPAG
jgi:hypothetical protein